MVVMKRASDVLMYWCWELGVGRWEMAGTDELRVEMGSLKARREVLYTRHG
jgi:hypothetical protein